MPGASRVAFATVVNDLVGADDLAGGRRHDEPEVHGRAGLLAAELGGDRLRAGDRGERLDRGAAEADRRVAELEGDLARDAARVDGREERGRGLRDRGAARHGIRDDRRARRRKCRIRSGRWRSAGRDGGRRQSRGRGAHEQRAREERNDSYRRSSTFHGCGRTAVRSRRLRVFAAICYPLHAIFTRASCRLCTIPSRRTGSAASLDALPNSAERSTE